MAPKILLRKALDYNARKVTSKLRVPFGTSFYKRRWLSPDNLDITRAPVIKDGEVLGTVSMTDMVIKGLLRDLDEES